MALLLLLAVLTAVVTLATVAALAHRPPPSRETAVAAARRHAQRTSTAALLLGAAAAGWVAVPDVGDVAPGALGVTALLVPIAFGVTHTVVLAVGELSWPRPEGPVRRARLVRRGPLDAAPRWLVRVTGGAGLAAVATIAIGAVLAAPDGRSIAYTSPDGLSESAASPFPGLVYGRPAALGLLVLGLAVTGALWIVAQRAAVATDDERIEAALRRASAHRVLRGAAATVLVVAGGLLAVGGLAASHVLPGLLSVVATCLTFLGGAGMLAGVVVGCIRAPGVPADAPAVPTA
jgi:hypothetical protein